MKRTHARAGVGVVRSLRRASISGVICVVLVTLISIPLGVSTPAEASIAGTFIPIVVNNGCTLTSGFSTSGYSVCGYNVDNGQRYIYLPSSGGSITYTFTVPAASGTITYGIPAGGSLNNVNALVSIDGGAQQAITADEGPFHSTTSSDLALWTSVLLAPGSHTWTITSTGDAVNVYGLWTSWSSTPAPPLTVSAVSPNDGPTTGGTSVTISGSGFSTEAGGTVFTFGADGPATNVSCASSSSCTAISPRGSPGTVDVLATVAGQSSSPNPPSDQFTYTIPTSIVVSSSSPADLLVLGQSVTFYAVVTPSVAGGRVAFSENGTTIGTCSSQSLSGSTATCTITPSNSGAQNIVAVYSGYGLFEASTSAAFTEVVTLHPCASLAGCDLDGLNLAGADFAGADLSAANLSRANLAGADLAGADLSAANLSRADLSLADLDNAKLVAANLANAELKGTYLDNAVLKGANFTGAVQLNQISTSVSLAAVTAVSNGSCFGNIGDLPDTSCFSIEQNSVLAAANEPNVPLFWLQNILLFNYSSATSGWTIEHQAEIWGCQNASSSSDVCNPFPAPFGHSYPKGWCSYFCEPVNFNYSLSTPASVSLTTTASKGTVTFDSSFGSLAPLVGNPLSSSTQYVLFSPDPSSGAQLSAVQIVGQYTGYDTTFGTPTAGTSGTVAAFLGYTDGSTTNIPSFSCTIRPPYSDYTGESATGLVWSVNTSLGAGSFSYQAGASNTSQGMVFSAMPPLTPVAGC